MASGVSGGGCLKGRKEWGWEETLVLTGGGGQSYTKIQAEQLCNIEQNFLQIPCELGGDAAKV